MSEFLTSTHHPFGPTMDTQRLYSDDARRHLAKSLETALLNGSKLIVILGEHGVGKSSLLWQLAEQVTTRGGIMFAFPRKIFACRTGVTPEAIAKLTQARPGATQDRRLGPESVSTAVLLLDDAEHLSGEVIRSLREQQEIAVSEGLPLVIVATMMASPLTGPEHEAISELTRGADLLLRLEPFSPEDAGRMIRYRLKISGYSQPKLFTPEAIDCIARATGGNPGRIISLCRTVMDIAERDHCYPILPVLVEDLVGAFVQDGAADADSDEHESDVPIMPDAEPAPSPASAVERHPVSTIRSEPADHPGPRRRSARTLVAAALAVVVVAGAAGSYLFAPELSERIDVAQRQETDLREASTLAKLETSASDHPRPEASLADRTSANEEQHTAALVAEASSEGPDPMKGAAPTSPDASQQSDVAPRSSAEDQLDSGHRAPETAKQKATIGQSDDTAVIAEASPPAEANSPTIQQSPDDEAGPSPSVWADSQPPSMEEQPVAETAAPPPDATRVVSPPEGDAPQPVKQIVTPDRSNQQVVMAEASTPAEVNSPSIEQGPDDEAGPSPSVWADSQPPSMETQPEGNRTAPLADPDRAASPPEGDVPETVNEMATRDQGNPRAAGPDTPNSRRNSVSSENPALVAPATENTVVQRESKLAPPTEAAVPIERTLTRADEDPETDLSLAAKTVKNPENQAKSKPKGVDSEQLIARGNKFLSLGDLVSARLLYRMAVKSGSGRAAHLLGQTYDPLFFRTAGIVGIRPSAPQAVEWYRKAEEMGYEEGSRRADALSAWLETQAR